MKLQPQTERIKIENSLVVMEVEVEVETEEVDKKGALRAACIGKRKRLDYIKRMADNYVNAMCFYLMDMFLSASADRAVSSKGRFEMRMKRDSH